MSSFNPHKNSDVCYHIYYYSYSLHIYYTITHYYTIKLCPVDIYLKTYKSGAVLPFTDVYNTDTSINVVVI